MICVWYFSVQADGLDSPSLLLILVANRRAHRIEGDDLKAVFMQLRQREPAFYAPTVSENHYVIPLVDRQGAASSDTLR